MTIVNAAAQREQLQAAVLAAPRGLELDLAEVGCIDSAGIQLMLAARRSLERENLPLTLANVLPAVADALGVYGLQTLLTRVTGARE